MSVRALPMSIWPQAMSYLRPSSDVALVRPVIACLVAVYGAEFGRGTCAEIEPLLTMRPPRGNRSCCSRNRCPQSPGLPVRPAPRGGPASRAGPRPPCPPGPRGPLLPAPAPPGPRGPPAPEPGRCTRLLAAPIGAAHRAAWSAGSRQRIDGVSRSLPYSDLLALTSSSRRGEAWSDRGAWKRLRILQTGHVDAHASPDIGTGAVPYRGCLVPLTGDREQL